MEFARDPIVTAATPTATPTAWGLIAGSFQSRGRGIGGAAIVAEFGAEFPDGYVDGPVHNGRLVVRIDGGEQLVAGEGALRRLQKGLQELELDGGDRKRTR